MALRRCEREDAHCRSQADDKHGEVSSDISHHFLSIREVIVGQSTEMRKSHTRFDGNLVAREIIADARGSIWLPSPAAFLVIGLLTVDFDRLPRRGRL